MWSLGCAGCCTRFRRMFLAVNFRYVAVDPSGPACWRVPLQMAVSATWYADLETMLGGRVLVLSL